MDSEKESFITGQQDCDAGPVSSQSLRRNHTMIAPSRLIPSRLRPLPRRERDPKCARDSELGIFERDPYLNILLMEDSAAQDASPLSRSLLFASTDKVSCRRRNNGASFAALCGESRKSLVALPRVRHSKSPIAVSYTVVAKYISSAKSSQRVCFRRRKPEAEDLELNREKMIRIRRIAVVRAASHGPARVRPQPEQKPIPAPQETSPAENKASPGKTPPLLQVSRVKMHEQECSGRSKSVGKRNAETQCVPEQVVHAVDTRAEMRRRERLIKMLRAKEGLMREARVQAEFPPQFKVVVRKLKGVMIGMEKREETSLNLSFLQPLNL